MSESKIKNKEVALYSQTAIAISTFIGSPLAAGYLVYKNFMAVNDPKSAKISLLIGCVSTLLLIVIIVSIPEESFKNVPNQIIPIIYTAITYFLIEKYQGDVLNAHLKNDNKFFSKWRAAGIGLIALLIVFGLMFGAMTLFDPNDEIYDSYDKELLVFTENEEAALHVYNLIDYESEINVLKELTIITIPKWEENINLLKSFNKTPSIPVELTNYNQNLLDYSTLRLREAVLLKQSISEQTDEYSEEIAEVNQQLIQILDKLN